MARSSTKSELIGVYDVLPQILWIKQVLEEQGWKDSATIVYQDNTSQILLERNGRSSSTKWTKHMNIRYFYVTEQVEKKPINVTHCTTEEMIGDFFTKPLQGSLFIKMHNYIMGSEEPRYQVLPRSVLRKHNFDNDNTRKQKFIGTWKCNPEAVAKIYHNHVTKDPDGSTKDDSSRNIQSTTRPTITGDEGVAGRGDGPGGQCGNNRDVIEPQSYRDVVVNGGNVGQLMR